LAQARIDAETGSENLEIYRWRCAPCSNEPGWTASSWMDYFLIRRLLFSCSWGYLLFLAGPAASSSLVSQNIRRRFYVSWCGNRRRLAGCCLVAQAGSPAPRYALARHYPLRPSFAESLFSARPLHSAFNCASFFARGGGYSLLQASDPARSKVCPRALRGSAPTNQNNLPALSDPARGKGAVDHGNR